MIKTEIPAKNTSLLMQRGCIGSIRAGFLFLFVFISYQSISAQNLQFSQVLYVNVPDTVPPGKVWKLEKVFNTGSNYRYLYVNNEPVGLIADRTYGVSANGSTYSSNFTGAAWFPAGTILGNAGAPEVRMSIIEFTVIP